MALNIARRLKIFQQSLNKPLTRFYHEKVIEHYENPRNVGSLDKSDDSVGTGLVGAPACGDVMKLQVHTRDKRLMFPMFAQFS
jgi:hypothetical protein